MEDKHYCHRCGQFRDHPNEYYKGNWYYKECLRVFKGWEKFQDDNR
jgi:hypothetical protein